MLLSDFTDSFLTQENAERVLGVPVLGFISYIAQQSLYLSVFDDSDLMPKNPSASPMDGLS